MQHRISKPELVLVVMMVLLGAVLRMSHTERLDVEHFDEGVYASSLWYEAAFGQPWPARNLYAPPLLPNLISASAAVTGTGAAAAFWPGLLLGSLTALVFWWMSRAWFGQTAGLVCVCLVALSDFHILFSRMALTDVPALLFISGSVAVAIHGLHTQNLRLMVAAGLLAGLAWWTKYTGWLALAIVGSGSAFWWLLYGRQSLSLLTLSKLWLVMAATAVLVWLPVLWLLQDSGGYAAVSANHAGYVYGFDGWRGRLVEHMVYHFRFDSWLGSAAIGLGTLAAGTRRWIELRLAQADSAAEDSSAAENSDASAAFDEPSGDFPSTAILKRLIIAAIALAVMASGIGTLGVLFCIAIGGIAGMFLWPTLTELHQRGQRTADQLTSPSRAATVTQIDTAEYQASPSVDPRMGACVVVAWFAGMLLTTPLYHPYPRLSLPLLAATWLAASGGLAWWMEATINSGRKGEERKAAMQATPGKRMLSVLVVVALALTLTRTDTDMIKRPSIWQDRTSLRDAAWQMAEVVLQDARGEFEAPATQLLIDEFGIIHPEPASEYDADGELLPGETVWQQMQNQLPSVADTSQPIADFQQPEAVVYGFGEPAVLKHLHDAGLRVAPVQDVTFSAATFNNQALPTYLVLGPYALRTPGLMDTWATQQQRFEHVTNLHFAPSEVVLYNLFSPTWVNQHPESRLQKLELYRLKTLLNGNEPN